MALQANSLFVDFTNTEQETGLFQSKLSFGKTQTSRLDINRIIFEESKRNLVSADLVHAIVKVESAYNLRALSNKGAMSLMQLMPDTAKRFGVRNSFNARENIQGGIKYLIFLINKFDNLEYSVAGYNAGEGAVIKYKGIPPYKETQNYVKKAMKIYKKRINLNS